MINLNDIFLILHLLGLLFYLNLILLWASFIEPSLSLGNPPINLEFVEFTLLSISYTYLLLRQKIVLDTNLFNFFLITNKSFTCSTIFLIFTFFTWIFIVKSHCKLEYIINYEYWLLVLLILLSSSIIILGQNFSLIYLVLELQSLLLYTLACSNKNSEFSTESALKYFILGAFSSCILLLGFVSLYFIFGLTQISELYLISHFSSIESSVNLFTFLLLIFIAFLFKLNAAPFQIWVPDIYEGAPSSVTSFFSLFPKLAIYMSIINFFNLDFMFFFFVSYLSLIISGLSSIFFGVFGAFWQRKWKRFFAYSSIAHIGFVLLSLCSLKCLHIVSSSFYLFSYILTISGVFCTFLSIRIKQGIHFFQPRFLKNCFLLKSSNTFITFGLSVILFSMAGIPPTLGFFAKVVVLMSLAQESLHVISILVVLLSTFGCYYYLKLISYMCFKDTLKWDLTFTWPKNNAIILSVCTITMYVRLKLFCTIK